MGVQLNIKNPEARSLAKQISDATGETITEAVTGALRLRLAALEREGRPTDIERREKSAQFYRLIAGSRGRWNGTMLSLDHGDLLYDEDGLPR